MSLLLGLLAACAGAPEQTSQSPRPASYEVQPGDTLSGIARQFGLSVNELSRYNPRLDATTLTPGARVRLPPSDTVSQEHLIYQVQRGDTLSAIAQHFSVSLFSLMQANPQLTDPDHLRVGLRLLIPVDDRGRNGYIWPLKQFKLGLDFGLYNRHLHKGVDLLAPLGTPFMAAQDGIVQFAGPMRGYGLVIVVGHPGNRQTIYAHCSELFVKAGQQVRRGEKLGRVGTNGTVNTSALHFEYRINGQPHSPRSYFPIMQ